MLFMTFCTCQFIVIMPQLQMSYQDGNPITSGEVFVRHAFLRDERSFVETRHSIPPSGGCDVL